MVEAAVLRQALTTRRMDILIAIDSFQSSHGFCPTLREIQETVGLAAISTVHKHLEVLREARLVDWMDGSARTLHLTDRGRLYVL